MRLLSLPAHGYCDNEKLEIMIWKRALSGKKFWFDVAFRTKWGNCSKDNGLNLPNAIELKQPMKNGNGFIGVI